MKGYGEDLAYVHDAGFTGYCLNAAPGLLRALKRNGITGGLVVDLGCGSGRWARALLDTRSWAWISRRPSFGWLAESHRGPDL